MLGKGSPPEALMESQAGMAAEDDLGADMEDIESSRCATEQVDEHGRVIKTRKLCGASCYEPTPLVSHSPRRSNCG